MSDYSGGQFFRLPTWLCDEVLICSPFTEGVTKCLFAIARKTIGYRKKSDAISVSQFKNMTKLCKQTIEDSCNYLAEKEIVKREKGPRNTWIYSLNKKEIILNVVEEIRPKSKKRNKSTVLPNRKMTVLSDRKVEDKKEAEKTENSKATVLSNRKVTVLSNRNTIDINRYIYINIYRSLVRHFKIGEVGYFDGIKSIEEPKSEPEKSLPVKAKKPKRKIFYEERDYKCAKWMLDRINTVLLSIGWKEGITANLDKWANTVRLMRTQDKHSYEDIFEMFKWANCDSFWKTNIRSPDKLREKWEELGIRRLEERNKLNSISSNTTSWANQDVEPEYNPFVGTIEEIVLGRGKLL